MEESEQQFISVYTEILLTGTKMIAFSLIKK